jgi:hypothetical protein
MSINTILNTLYQNYAQFFPPVQMMDIQRTSIALVKKGWIQIPSDYIQFLHITDGLSWNGLELFAIHEHERRDSVFGQPTLLAYQTEYSLKQLFPKSLIVGRATEALILYRLDLKEYHILDRYTFDVIIKLPRLTDVLHFYAKSVLSSS